MAAADQQEHFVVAHPENLPADALRPIAGEIDGQRRDLLRRHLLQLVDARLSASVLAGMESIIGVQANGAMQLERTL